MEKITWELNLILIWLAIKQSTKISCDDDNYQICFWRRWIYPKNVLDDALYEVQMLEYDRIDASEVIDVNETSASK